MRLDQEPDVVESRTLVGLRRASLAGISHREIPASARPPRQICFPLNRTALWNQPGVLPPRNQARHELTCF